MQRARWECARQQDIASSRSLAASGERVVFSCRFIWLHFNFHRVHRDNYSVGSSRSWMPAFAVNWQSTEGNSSQHQRRRQRRQQQHLCADDVCTCIIAIFIFAPCAVCARTLPSNYKFLNCSTAHICTFNSKLLCSSTLPRWTTAHISLHKL